MVWWWKQLMLIQTQIAGLVFAGFGLSASVFSGKSQMMFLQSFLPCEPIKSNHLLFEFDLFSCFSFSGWLTLSVLYWPIQRILIKSNIMVFDVQGYKVSLSTHQMWDQSRRNIALGNHPAQHTFTRFCKEIKTILYQLTFTRFWNQFYWILNLLWLSCKTSAHRYLIHAFINNHRFHFYFCICPERSSWIPSTFNGCVVSSLHRWVRDMINRFTRVLNAGLLVPGLLLAVERPKEVQLSKSGLGCFISSPFLRNSHQRSGWLGDWGRL